MDALDFAIVGAGLTGLSLGWDLVHKFPDRACELVEKSKGCGGRMATRRVDNFKFDHGAQFIKQSEVSAPWFELWRKADALVPFPADQQATYCGRSGMTDLAKVLSRPLRIRYNEKIIALQRTVAGWSFENEQGRKTLTKTLVLTAPLPQTLELLKTADVEIDPGLAAIEYAPALVLLIEPSGDWQPPHAYLENPGAEVFSLSAQHFKGNAQSASWTLVMNPEWSRKHYDLGDDQIRDQANTQLAGLWPNFRFTTLQIKKWRYAQPFTHWTRLFENPAPGLYLAGDAFGGPSLNGALRSSRAVFDHIHNNY